MKKFKALATSLYEFFKKNYGLYGYGYASWFRLKQVNAVGFW